jgi:hypothetical protein
MEDVKLILKTQINQLDLKAVENAISAHFELGYPQHSTLPEQIRENDSGVYALAGCRGLGVFLITIHKLKNSRYSLKATLKGEIKRF